jgi:hypothetical protein
VKANARKAAGLLNPDTGDYYEVDLFLPELKLGFEYQEQHHFQPQAHMEGHSLAEIQVRDKRKKGLALQKGITLIAVPWWWDGATAR